MPFYHDHCMNCGSTQTSSSAWPSRKAKEGHHLWHPQKKARRCWCIKIWPVLCIYLAKLSYFTNLNFPDNKAKPPFGSIWGVKKSANLCLKNLPTKNCVPETGSEFGKGISGKSLEQMAVDTWAMKKKTSCLVYFSGILWNYPVMWGLFHKPWK